MGKLHKASRNKVSREARMRLHLGSVGYKWRGWDKNLSNHYKYDTQNPVLSNIVDVHWKKFGITSHIQRFIIHLAVCLTTGPKPLPKRALHIVRSRASSFKWEYHLLSLRSSSSFLHLLPSLPVTSIFSFIFPSKTRCRRQFIRKMWPIQLSKDMYWKFN